MGLSLNWMSIARVLLLSTSFWVVPSSLLSTIKLVCRALNQEVKVTLGQLVPASLNLFVVSLFIFVLVNNLLGLLPFVFTGTRHLVFTSCISLRIWVGYILSFFLKNRSSFLAHLVPLGTPLVLVPVMVLIELVRSIMRPFTLAIRLAANIIAGHLLLDLCSIPIINAALLTKVVFFISLLALSTLEFGVALIQAYVFTRLSSLYIAEVNSPNL